MDNLTRKLREDASRIRADVSPELDARIRASLEAAEPVRPDAPKPAARTAPMWWWSSLVGASGALLVIVLLNLNAQPDVPVPAENVPAENGVPALSPPLNIQQAVLTGPLEEELENLESDLRRAEAALRADIGIIGRDEETPDDP